jgi:hypothetical protein
MRDLVKMILRGLDGTGNGSGTCRGLKGDVYLAFSGVESMRIEGFVVTEPGEPDEVLAWVPLASPEKSAEAPTLAGALKLYPHALAVARQPRRESPYALRVGDGRPVPRWMYGLKCVPLTRAWDGRWVEVSPFTEDLFTAMASSPKARKWLAGRASGQPSQP